MAKYRKKPLMVEAIQFDPSKPLPLGVTEWDHKAYWTRRDGEGVSKSYSFINQGHAEAIKKGDWIVTSNLGERYVIPDGVFQKTHDLVE